MKKKIVNAKNELFKLRKEAIQELDKLRERIVKFELERQGYSTHTN